jgi:hypothetical protein
VLPAGGVLQEHQLAALVVPECEDLERLGRARPARVPDSQANRNVFALLDELQRFESSAAAVVIGEKVHDLPSVPSDRCRAVDAAPRDAEPQSILGEEPLELGDAAAVEFGESTAQGILSFTHAP